MRAATSLISIIDDDPGVRGALENLLCAVGFRVLAFASAEDFLACPEAADAACLVLDVRLRDVDGLEFQQSLLARDVQAPVVLITGHGDIPMTVRAMKAGAVDFLLKPFDDERLLAAVAEAVERDRARRGSLQEEEGIRLRYAQLTPREREVMSLVAAGLMNKQIAGRLELSEITVKIHRGNLMRKMRAQSLADLVRMAERLRVRASRVTRRCPQAG